MAISLMLKPGDELMTLVINSMRNDIVGQLHGGQCLGLAAVLKLVHKRKNITFIGCMCRFPILAVQTWRKL